ncbi:hypothetical protein N0V94_002430 [Neodidymelliopsis sp. IMI 364377]|nr:hypothetical protein N0V94_002430 [Neodidymelliopsis sp. IMI 364377]
MLAFTVEQPTPDRASWRVSHPMYSAVDIADQLLGVKSLYSVTHHLEQAVNTTLASRDTKGICTRTDLPTEASYKLGYETFCNTYFTGTEPQFIIPPEGKTLTGTVFISDYNGRELAWVFKVIGESWFNGRINPLQYTIKRDMCLDKFKGFVEGKDSEVGQTYCVVRDTGGEGDSKGMSGQGKVLVMGGKTTVTSNEFDGYATFETRRRKG